MDNLATADEIGQSLLTRSRRNVNPAFQFLMIMGTVLYNLAQFCGNLYRCVKVDRLEILLQQREGRTRFERPMKRNVGKHCKHWRRRYLIRVYTVFNIFI